MRKCPKCGSKHILTERRVDGYSSCKECKFKAKTSVFDKAEELKEEKFLDLFLSEAIAEVPDNNPSEPSNVPKSPVVENPAPAEPPVDENTDSTDMSETPVEVDAMTKDIIKYDNIDLNVVTPKTSKFFSFDALRTTLKSLNSLIDIQDKISLDDEKDAEVLRNIKEKTVRLKIIILKYIANFKSYEQSEIDTIRPIFEKIGIGLAKETKTMVKKIN